MEFFRRAVPPPVSASGASSQTTASGGRRRRPARLGVFPGTSNPVTVAHLALARAALDSVDEVLFVLPREFPHKRYSGASFQERVEMLCASLADEPAFSLSATAGGLFAEIAVECRQAYGESVQLWFLCGRDAAERVANWDYGQPDAFAGMLRGFEILVASRGGDWDPGPQLRARVRRLEIAAEFEGVSATEVRRRIAHGEPWEHMAPPAVRETAGRIYRLR